MTKTNCLDVRTGYIVRLITVLIYLLKTGVDGQERQLAHSSYGGVYLCHLVEDFYSYRRSAAYGPDRWGEISECCLGHRQSPRDLVSSSPSMCGYGRAVSFSYNSSRSIPGSLYNNGYDPVVAFQASNTEHLLHAPYTTEPYLLDNIHIHFCTASVKGGSEHAIDGRFHHGEIHLVHYKASYGSVANAALHEDGLVVIAIMIEPVSLNTHTLNNEVVKIIGKMSHLQGVGKEFQLPIEVSVPEIFPRSQAFFTYAGSLTSPPCTEAVRWIIMRDPIHISQHEIDILGRLLNEEGRLMGQTCNDRPLQHGNTHIETNFACATLRPPEEDGAYRPTPTG